MFLRSEKYYDEIYAAMGKDYAAEADAAHCLIQKFKRAGGSRLLDVACGTAPHVDVLSKFYKVEGLDYDQAMLALARKKHPGMKFHHGSMIDFKLKRRFDAVVCLFSSIGYVRTKTNLRKAIRIMQSHLSPGGVLLVEPWFAPDQWNVGFVHTAHVNKKDLKIARMSFSGRKGNVSTIDFHYLVGKPGGLEHFTEHHELGLFTQEEYMDALRAAGLKAIYHKKGVDGRGLYIGIKP